MTANPQGYNAHVAVVIPTRNRARLLVDAVDSVLAQTTPPKEVIVVDDASEDDTLARLERFGDRVEVIAMGRNVERGSARNAGAAASSSPLLAFLDSDDAWEPNKMQRQLEEFGGLIPSVTGIALMNEGGSLTGETYTPPPGADLSLLTQNNMLGSPSSILLPRTAFEEAGGFPEERQFQGSEDWMFLVKLLWAGWSIRSIREPLVRYRVHPGGSTQTAGNLERSMWAASMWVEEQPFGGATIPSRRRGYVAMTIACAFAREHKWAKAMEWTHVAASHGTPIARLVGLLRIAKSVFVGAYRQTRTRR